MSLKAVVWAIERDDIFSSPQKFVLVALANFANDEGYSYPQVSTLCGITLQMDKTVRRALKSLVDAGIITDTGKRHGPTQQVKVYRFPKEVYETGRPPKRQVLELHPKTPRRPPEDPPKTGEKEGQSLEPVTLELGKGALEAEAPKAPCPTRVFSDAWCAAYLARFGAKYNYNGRDAKAAAELVKLDDPRSLVEIAKKAWQQMDDKKFWACINRSATTWDFLASLSKIRMELARAKAFNSRPIEFHYERNQNH